MADLDRPVTRREMRAELEIVLKTLATKDDLKAFATKEDLKAFATKDDLKALREELRTHFDIVAESLRVEFRSVIDCRAISASAPASSTPVAPPPTITKVR